MEVAQRYNQQGADEITYYQSDYNEEEKAAGMADEVNKFAKDMAKLRLENTQLANKAAEYESAAAASAEENANLKKRSASSKMPARSFSSARWLDQRSATPPTAAT